MCRAGITIAPRGEMIMKSRMTVNCRNPRMPITTFWYAENWIRVGLLVAVLSMDSLRRSSDPCDAGSEDAERKSRHQALFFCRSAANTLSARQIYDHQER